MKAGQDLADSRRPRCPPPLLAANDLVPARRSCRRLDLQQRLMPPRLHRGHELVDQLHRDIDAWLDRARFNLTDWEEYDATWHVVGGDAQAASPPGGRSGSTRVGPGCRFSESPASRR